MLGARAGSGALSLVSVLITTRLLEPAGYGALAYYVVIATLIFTVTSGWTSTSVARYGRDEFEETGSLASLTWSRARLSLPLYLLAVALVVVLTAAGVFPDEFTWAFAGLAVGSGAVMVLSDHLIYSLEAAGRIKQSALWVIGQHAGVVLSLLGILVLGLDVGALAVASISTGWAVAFMLGLIRLEWGLAIRPYRWERRLVRRILHLSLPLIAFTASQYAIRSVDLFVLGAFASAALVGIYAVAYQAYLVLQQLTTATGPVLTPLFVSLRRADREDVVARYYERVVPQLTFLAAILAGLAVPFVEIAVPLVFGEAFEEAAVPLSILLLALVLGFAANLLGPIIVLHERTRPIGVINIYAAGVNIVADIVLVGVFGFYLAGPAIATVLAIAIVLIGYAVVAGRCTASPRTSALALGPAALPYVAGAAPALVLPEAPALIGALLAVPLCAIAVQLTARPFAPDDAALISQLDLPGPLKRATLRTLELATR